MNTKRLPDFIIIGAAKSGTTSLHHNLMQHPDIFMSEPKEPCFFDEAVAWDKGLDWYCSLFEEAKRNQLCGEASTNYTRWPQVEGVPEKIKKCVPQVKLIYVVRNPVDRAYSHYVHRWTKEVHPDSPFTLDFFEYAKIDPMCIDSSKYATQLDRYLMTFDKGQILVIVFEELVRNPSAAMARVYEFLGLNRFEGMDENLSWINDSGQFRYHTLRKQLTSRIKRIWGVRSLGKIVPESLRDQIYKNVILKTNYAEELSSKYTPPPLSDQEKELLMDLFSESNARLERTWDVDIGYWS